MPVYDYLCPQCGPFTEMRPMSESDRPRACPACGDKAPRAFLTAPYLAAMTAERRRAHATNERNAAAPRTLSGSQAAHGSGCGCCSARSNFGAAARRKGAKGTAAKGTATKSFPARRPWMISH